jgi:hypothetical protein
MLPAHEATGGFSWLKFNLVLHTEVHTEDIHK